MKQKAATKEMVSLSVVQFIGLGLLCILLCGGAKSPAFDRELLRSFVQPTPNAAVTSPLASFGEKLFSETGFSPDGISCASCHDPHKFFVDGKRFAVGIRQGPLNTPTLVDVAQATALMHDGRYGALRALVYDPLFAPDEMGSDPVRVCRTLLAKHQGEYSKHFGALPGCEVSLPPPNAMPVAWSDNFLWFIRQSNRDPIWGRVLATLGAPKSIELLEPMGVRWHLDPNLAKTELKAVVSNVGNALASYLATLKWSDTAFDRFARHYLELEENEAPPFAADFGATEWRGYDLFVGKANCVQCHFGSRFTGDGFFNLGRTSSSALGVRLGRAQGLRLFHALQFEEDRLSEIMDLLGAVRVPSLRSIAHTKPYFWDGSLAELEDVIAFYNEGRVSADIGTGIGVIQPLGLSQQEQSDLVAFLRSLTAPLAQ